MIDWREAPLSREHDRSGFDCGVASLNEYLARYARQGQDRGLAKTYVAVDPGAPTRILGYYTITLTSVDSEALPPPLAARLLRYPVPLYRLARLAVSVESQRQGLGAELLVTAADRARQASTSVGGFGLLIDAIDEDAARWYERFGAVRLADHPLTLVLSFATLEAALMRSEQADERP